MVKALVFPLRMACGALLILALALLLAVITLASWCDRRFGEPFAYGRQVATKSKS